jgi:predicted Zn-dependent protease
MTILKKFVLLLSLLPAISTVVFAEAPAQKMQPSASKAVAPEGAQTDPVLRALQTEMDRSKAKLRLENSPAPYFIGYRIVDIDNWEADAALGGVRSETRTRIRFLMVQVRLGDYKQDNSSSRGDGAVEVVPLDSDELALRRQVWTATDKAYKQAVEALTAKQAKLKQLTIDHPVDDFARAGAVQSVQPLAEMKLVREPWLALLRDVSGLYRRDPKVQFLQASLNFSAINRYYVNSEGTVVRGGEELYRMLVGGNTQAADGMRLDRSMEITARSVRDLPKAAEFQARAAEMVETLKELREAPLADEVYHGPVLLSADAASTVISSLVGENLLGHKPELGQNARVHGQFASSYRSRVLPEFLSIVDDPTLAEFKGTSLLGHYAVDDEGVAAQRVPVIEKGVLVSYLLGRQPIRDFPASNGHGRASLPLSWPAPALGNLVVNASNPVPADELKNKLIAMCRDRGLDYGYYAKSLGGPREPRMLYRVWAKDGREELVRGALFGDLDQRSMRSSIVAAGNDLFVDNEIQPSPHSIVSPSILFDDLEVKRQTADKDNLPEYPAPQEAAAK